MPRRSLFLLLFFGLGLGRSLLAHPIDFDLPAQPAVRSLVAFSRQAEVDVLFSYEALKLVETRAVRGRYEPPQALALLLTGTGCTVTTSPTGKFVVVAPTPAPPQPAAVNRLPAPSATTVRAGAADEAVQLERLVVTPSRFGIDDDPALPTATLSHREITALPQLGDDLFRTVTWVPGLTASDFSAKFWIRGAPNEQVLIRLDGATLLEPFHLKDLDGALTVIDLETIERLELVTGGLTADYGDRLAGALTLESTRPRADQPRHSLGLSLTGARFTTRGIFAAGRGTYLLSARAGYPDLQLGMVNSEEIQPRYHDVFGKFDFDLAPGQRVAVSVLHAFDTFSYRRLNTPGLATRHADDYLWLRWQARFGERLRGETVLTQSWLGWHRSTHGTFEESGRSLRRDLQDDRQLALTSLRQDWTVGLGGQALLRTGFEAARGLAEYDYHGANQATYFDNQSVSVVSRSRTAHLHNRGNSLGGYASVRAQAGAHLTLEAGARGDRQNYAGGPAVTPRFNAVLDLGRTTWRAAWGRYRQAEGLHEIAVADGETRYHSAERTEQIVLGLEHRLRGGTQLRLELYQRDTTDPRPRWTNLLSALDLLPEFAPDRILLAPSRSRARGLELNVSRRVSPALRWSASYTLATAEDTVAGRAIPVAHDQRHTVQANLAWSPNPRWDVSASWQYHTGWPTTEGFFVTIPVTGGLFVQPQFGPPFAGRLPDYHRCDFRATRFFRLRHSTVRVFVDLFNAYDEANIYRYSFAYQRVGNQFRHVVTSHKSLPLLPSAGVAWDF
jgi:hypothetical protein